jgi:hypothetical protein
LRAYIINVDNAQPTGESSMNIQQIENEEFERGYNPQDRFAGFDRGDDARTEHAEWLAAQNEEWEAEWLAEQAKAAQ